MTTATLSDDLADALAEPPAPVVPEQTTAADAEPTPARPRSRSGSRKPRAEKAPRKPGAPRTATPRRAPLAPRVAQAHMLLGFGVSFAPIPNGQAVGIALAAHADSIGEAWEALAKENPRVREVLEKLLTAGAVGQLMMAYLPVMLAAAGKAGDLESLGNLAGALGDLPPMPDAP